MKKIAFIITLVFALNNLYAQSNNIGAGIALKFDGNTGSYLDLGDVYNDINFPLTVEAWVKPTAWTPGGYSPIISTENVGVGGSYYGFWFRFNSTGKLIFEIGDGSGSGGSDRRGKVTTSSVSLNKWTHVAVVATSVTDIKFYFNGVLQLSSNTDGGGSNVNIVHTTYPTTIGRQVTPTTEHNFMGQIDEVRLWDLSRTELELRDNMCLKLTSLPINLIGYWNFNESYIDSSVNDLTSPSENGTLIGTVIRNTSGAPIGDERVYAYLVDYSGFSLVLNSPGGDKMRINKIVNLPYGVHLYRVDNLPYDLGGLTSTPSYYYGVFTADGVVTAKYNSNYVYSFTNGIVSPANEELSTTFQRLDGSITSWVDFTSTLSIPNSSLVKKNCVGRNEFIFNISALNLNKIEGKSSLEIYPNPTNDYFVIKPVSMTNPIYIYNNGGQLVKTIEMKNENNLITIEISDLPQGIYHVSQKSEDSVFTSKLYIQ